MGKDINHQFIVSSNINYHRPEYFFLLLQQLSVFLSNASHHPRNTERGDSYVFQISSSESSAMNLNYYYSKQKSQVYSLEVAFYRHKRASERTIVCNIVWLTWQLDKPLVWRYRLKPHLSLGHKGLKKIQMLSERDKLHLSPIERLDKRRVVIEVLR